MVEKSKGRKEEVVSREYTSIFTNIYMALHIQEEGPYCHQGNPNVCSESYGNKGCACRRQVEQASVEQRNLKCSKGTRVRIARKRHDDEDANEKLYSVVTVAEIPPEGLKGLGTKVIDDED